MEKAYLYLLQISSVLHKKIKTKIFQAFSIHTFMGRIQDFSERGGGTERLGQP